MPRKNTPRHQIDTVKASDCIDVTDYYMVHKAYFDGMREAIRKAHARITVTPVGACLCIYCQSPASAGEKP